MFPCKFFSFIEKIIFTDYLQATASVFEHNQLTSYLFQNELCFEPYWKGENAADIKTSYFIKLND